MYQSNEHSGPVVYSSDQKYPPTYLRYALSIKVIAYASAMVIIFLFLGIIAVNLTLGKGHFQDSKNHPPQYLTDKATAIETQLAFINQIIRHVARQPTTQDILEYKNKVGAQAWAAQMRRFLPQALGVSLLTPDGKVLGDPPGQRLTPQCLTDMSKIFQHEATKTPAVHTDSTGSTHFDLTAQVLDESKNPIGMLFVSVGLDELNALLNKNANAEGHFTLLDGYGAIIGQQKISPLQDGSSQPDNHLKSQIGIADTDWQLHLSEPGSGLNASFLVLAIFNVSALLLTVAIMAYLVRYIVRSMGTDFEQVKSLLNNLAEGESLDDELATPRLRETAEIFPAISHINRNLDKKQQLLEHQELNDKLTGLSNRRQFNIEFARAYDFARRGTPVCVVIMGLPDIHALNANQTNQIIKILGKTLREHARKVDHPARLDSDTFALLMFGASPEGTTPCLERMSQSFRQHQKEHPAIPNEMICTLYCGYTKIHAHRDKSAAEVLKRAEGALAQAQASTDHHIVSA